MRKTRMSIMPAAALCFYSLTLPLAAKAASGIVPAWEFHAGGELWSPLREKDGLIIFGGREPALFALDPGSGEVRWKHPYTDGYWIESTAVMDSGKLYVGSSDSKKVSAFNPATGKELWSAATGGWSWATPLVDHGVVYIGALGAPTYKSPDERPTASGFFAFDAASGKLIWRLPMANRPPVLNGDLDGGVFAQPVVVDGNVIVPEIHGTLKAIPITKIVPDVARK